MEKALAENRAAQYLQQGSVTASDHSEGGSMEDFENAAEGIASFQDEVLENVQSRREAIKQEILRLEKELADEQ